MTDGFSFDVSAETSFWRTSFTQGSSDQFTFGDAANDFAILGVSIPIGDATGILGFQTGFDGDDQIARQVGYDFELTGLMLNQVQVDHTAYAWGDKVYSTVYSPGSWILEYGSDGGPLLSQNNKILGVKSYVTEKGAGVWGDIDTLYRDIQSWITSNDYLLNDTSKAPANPTYAISTTSGAVNEGTSAQFLLATTNVAAGTVVAYTVSGVSASDVVGGALSGSVNVGSNGQATISVPLAADNLTEGSETLTVTAQGRSASVAISDTSTGTTESDSSSIPQGNYTLNVIVDLFGQVLYLKDLKETITAANHTVEYAGTTFNWSEVDSFVTTVIRDGNFTDEFAKEIADAYPSVAGISYSTAVALVGASAIDSVLISVAGADGNYVG